MTMVDYAYPGKDAQTRWTAETIHHHCALLWMDLKNDSRLHRRDFQAQNRSVRAGSNSFADMSLVRL
jgi:hypothetical protein